MKEQRLKAGRHIFTQYKIAKSIPDGEPFDASVVDCSDIDEHGRYCAAFVLVPSVASHICTAGRTTCEADAAHCNGIVSQSYRLTFEVVAYDCYHHLFPIVFEHFCRP